MNIDVIEWGTLLKCKYNFIQVNICTVITQILLQYLYPCPKAPLASYYLLTCDWTIVIQFSDTSVCFQFAHELL